MGLLACYEVWVCGRSWVRAHTRKLVRFSLWTVLWKSSPWGSLSYRPSAPPSYKSSSHVISYAYSCKLLYYYYYNFPCFRTHQITKRRPLAYFEICGAPLMVRNDWYMSCYTRKHHQYIYTLASDDSIALVSLPLSGTLHGSSGRSTKQLQMTVHIVYAPSEKTDIQLIYLPH